MSTQPVLRLASLPVFVILLAGCGEGPYGPAAPPPAAAALHNLKRPPRPGDWLDRFPSSGESFERYVAGRPVRADLTRNTLAFVPVGKAIGAEPELLHATAEFAGLWYRLPTRTLPEEPLPESGHSRQRIMPDGGPGRQYRTDWFLWSLLPPLLTDDAVCLVAVTLGDLYPSEDWNYVFGMASFRERVAVFSLARYRAEFWGLEETDATRRTALVRALKVVTHELGHCFGLVHCVKYECNMNGSNSLGETDLQPLRLCPDCLRKLAWNRAFDLRKRFEGLLAFYDGAGLDEEAAWVRRRLALFPPRTTGGAGEPDGR